jgi:hypothetical protein
VLRRRLDQGCVDPVLERLDHRGAVCSCGVWTHQRTVRTIATPRVHHEERPVRHRRHGRGVPRPGSRCADDVRTRRRRDRVPDPALAARHRRPRRLAHAARPDQPRFAARLRAGPRPVAAEPAADARPGEGNARRRRSRRCGRTTPARPPGPHPHRRGSTSRRATPAMRSRWRR